MRRKVDNELQTSPQEGNMLQKEKDILRIEHSDENREEFSTLCKRVESMVRAWYYLEFDELKTLYSLFDPAHGSKKLEQQELSPAKVDVLEQCFLTILFQVMEKSNFKILSDDEVEVATSGEYLLNLPIAVDTSKLDTRLFTTFFNQNHFDQVPNFAHQYIIFRRGIGIDHTTDYFIKSKLDLIISHTWTWLLEKLRLQKPHGDKKGLSRRLSRQQTTVPGDGGRDQGSQPDQDLYVERIRIQNMDINVKNLFKKNTVQEPTFDRIILVYRKRTLKNDPTSPLGDRSIYIKHFRNIPMADMEIVLPEKKSPGLTPMDWLKLCITAIVGLVAFIGSLELGKVDIWVTMAILFGIIGYAGKIYFSFQADLMEYQSLITQSMYDKQLDSGRGTLLHLCDDVIQQEVKEVLLAYFVLMAQGKATKEDLDRRCEQLLATQFNERCDFEVEDAIAKLVKLGIVYQDSLGVYCHQPLKQANKNIGVTTDELVEKSRSTE